MLLNKHLNKVTVLASVLLISNPAFADNKSKHSKQFKEKISEQIKKHNSRRGKKASQAALDAEVANRVAADQVLQNNIDTISLTPGPQGEAGATGVAGPQGIQGKTGLQGIQGEIGLTGATGKDGIQGVQGVTGAKGDKGDKGDEGVAGIDGAAGATGSIGEIGNPGRDGIDGLSCWDLNGDGGADANEDINGDQLWDTKDCQGVSTSSSSGIPVIWSGYCNRVGYSRAGAAGVRYCATNANINTARTHLFVEPNGNITVHTSGYYRVNSNANAHGIGHSNTVQLYFNGVRKQHLRQYSNQYWINIGIDHILSLNVGDRFEMVYATSQDRVAHMSGPTDSSMEVIYIWPLQ